MRHYEELVRKDVDVNEYDRLSTIKLKIQIKVKEHCFYCCSTFHSNIRDFNNEYTCNS